MNAKEALRNYISEMEKNLQRLESEIKETQEKIEELNRTKLIWRTRTDQMRADLKLLEDE